MYKLYSVEQANGLLPEVADTLQAIRNALTDLNRLRLKAASVQPFSMEARDALMESSFLVSEIQDSKAALDRLGVRITDLETGRIGIPGQVGAELVWLTWEPGQDGITHFLRMGEETAAPRLISQPESRPESASA